VDEGRPYRHALRGADAGQLHGLAQLVLVRRDKLREDLDGLLGVLALRALVIFSAQT
jgi:hypothetical protein